MSPANSYSKRRLTKKAILSGLIDNKERNEFLTNAKVVCTNSKYHLPVLFSLHSCSWAVKANRTVLATKELGVALR